MREPPPKTVYLKDYTPPAFLVSDVELEARRAAIARAILEANGFRARFLNGVRGVPNSLLPDRARVTPPRYALPRSGTDTVLLVVKYL